MTQEYLTDIVLIINNIVGLFVVLRYFNHIFDRKEFASINKKLGLMLPEFVKLVVHLS
jgi:hypothetical protein